MGAEAFEAGYAAGRALTYEQVLALALRNQALGPVRPGLTAIRDDPDAAGMHARV
jgi:hypothetical protein